MLGSLEVHESRLETQHSSKRKSVLNPRLSNVFPNVTAVKVLRNMKTNEISWDDENNLVPREKKEEIEICLQQKGEKRSLHQKVEEMPLKQKDEEIANCLFDKICKWYPPDESIPFLRELLFFISENVEINRRGRNGQTPMMIAARFDADGAIANLIERSANVKAVDNDRWTALHISSLYGHEKSCTVLLRSGANCDARARHGNTPMMIASINGKFEIVKLLLASGANPKISNNYSKTAVKLARLCNHQNCVQIIKAHAKMADKVENKLKRHSSLETPRKACTYSCLLRTTFFN